METLVLSSSYVPLRKVSWFRSMNWLLSGRVELVIEYDDQTISAFSKTFKTPAVVRYKSRGSAVFHQPRGIRLNRKNVWIRDGERCQYCGKLLTRNNFTLDHVIPRHRGGTTCWENVVVCCYQCNQKKGGKTPHEAGMRLISPPGKPQSLPRFFPERISWDTSMPEQWRAFLNS